MYNSFPRNFYCSGGSLLGTSIVHFILCLIPLYAQDPGLQLCPLESLVSSVGLPLAFFHVDCDLTLSTSHLTSDCN